MSDYSTSSKRFASEKAKSTGLAFLIVFGWIPAFASLYVLVRILYKNAAYLKRRMFDRSQWQAEMRKREKSEKKKRAEGLRASGIWIPSDHLGEMWERDVGCGKGWWTRLRKGKQVGKEEHVDVEMGDTEKQNSVGKPEAKSHDVDIEMGDTEKQNSVGKPEAKGHDVDVEMGDTQDQRRRDSGSTEGAWSIGTAESFSSVTPVLRREKEEMELKAAPTTWSRIKSIFRLPLNAFRLPQQSSHSGTENKNTKDCIRAVAEDAQKKAAEDAQAEFNSQYEQLIADIRPKCRSAAQVLEAKTPLERSRMNLEWIRENREVYHKCAGWSWGYVKWHENGSSRSGECDICKS